MSFDKDYEERLVHYKGESKMPSKDFIHGISPPVHKHLRRLKILALRNPHKRKRRMGNLFVEILKPIDEQEAFFDRVKFGKAKIEFQVVSRHSRTQWLDSRALDNLVLRWRTRKGW